jgi:hypothetical protein
MAENVEDIHVLWEQNLRQITESYLTPPLTTEEFQRSLFLMEIPESKYKSPILKLFKQAVYYKIHGHALGKKPQGLIYNIETSYEFTPDVKELFATYLTRARNEYRAQKKEESVEALRLVDKVLDNN